MRSAALAVVIACLVAVAASGCGSNGDDQEPTARSQWSIIEDHTALIRSGHERRAQTLREFKELGADTVRLAVKWNEVAPSPRSARRPSFDGSDPGAYPGFEPFDDAITEAQELDMRVLIDLAPDAPRWATKGAPEISAATVNDEPDVAEFTDFAAAVAKRYSGDFEDLPEVDWISIWNEPNHWLFLKPAKRSPDIYREMVAGALPRIRAENENARVLAGETAAVGNPGTVIGPREFVQRWLCLDDQFRPVRTGKCRNFEPLELDGYAHHPYGPAERVPRKKDIVSLLVIRRLGRYLDAAARANRLPPGLPIYSTEFGLQSNPPDPTVGNSPRRQAALLNEKEEQGYRYPLLRSHAQYLLYDDPPRPGATEKEVWSGFQTGLRFNDGTKKPAWDTYRLPLVVHRADDGRVLIWGRVRPGSGVRYVQLERREGGSFVADGSRLATDDAGYFEVHRPRPASYRFRAFEEDAEDAEAIGTSRVATPTRPTGAE
jgi:hypothetical protein